jgi:hypothetical protein
MVLTELDPSQSKLLGALTLTALKHLGEATLVVDEDNAPLPRLADGAHRRRRAARVGRASLPLQSF